MKERDKQLKKYYRAIRSWLPCSGGIKKKIIHNIEATIQVYLEENSGADFAEIEQHYGTPQQIAATYIDEMGTVELMKQLKTRRRIVYTVFTATAIVVLLWTTALTVALIDSHKSTSRHYHVTITEE